jgi:hypothetical protein
LQAHISNALTEPAAPSEGSIQILLYNSFFKNSEPEKYIIPNKRDKYTFLSKVNQQCFIMINTQLWILNSGATYHMIENKKLLYDYKKNRVIDFVYVANGEKNRNLWF